MDRFEEFVTGLLHEGRVAFRDAPPREPGPRWANAGVAALAKAFEGERLEVAGPLIAFEPNVAAKAAELVRLACWALVSRNERAEDLGRAITMGRAPKQPSDHLSADLALRYLPQVYKRAQAVDAGDPLVTILADVLRAWPLSGVLADLNDPPSMAVDFGGHRGLLLLYGERFATRKRLNWEPTGRGGEVLDWVEQANGRGRDRP